MLAMVSRTLFPMNVFNVDSRRRLEASPEPAFLVEMSVVRNDILLN